MEFRRLFADAPLHLRLPSELGLAPLHVPEPAKVFAENALAKALAYMEAYRMPAIADDSGICVDALAGAPGVRSARFGDPALDDAGRAHFLLSCLATIPPGRRGAHYTCSLAFALPNAAPLVVHGHCYGVIADRYIPGPTGFGYDPVFVIPSLGLPVSQLRPEQKDAIGHRGKAARALVAALMTKPAFSGTMEA